MMQRFAASLRRYLATPTSIPGSVVVLVLLLIIAQVCTLLMNQPTAYWLDPQYVSTNLPLSFLLERGPWVFILGTLIYIVIAGLLLKTLKRTAAFFLACWLSIIHLLILSWSSYCGFYPICEISTGSVCTAFQDGEVLIYIILFFFLLLFHLPERMIIWGKRIALFLSIAWLFLLGYGLFRAVFPPQSDWWVIAPQHSPGPRYLSAIAYDTTRQRAILFGGVQQWADTDTIYDNTTYDNTTWEWDGYDWQEIKTEISPPGRVEAGMAYDEIRNVIFLFGGKNSSGVLGDFWEFDGSNWRQLCSVCNPAGRYSHVIFYDPGREQIVVYGGSDDEKALAGTWAWNGDSWYGLSFSTSHPALLASPLVYDESRQRALSFMKDTWGGTWIWEGDSWSRLELELEPPLRRNAILVYNPETTKSILFGGAVDDTVAGAATYKSWLNDTWIFDGETWEQLDTPTAPPQRSGSMAFYDEVRHSMVIYGGEIMGRIYGDMWELVLPGEK